MHTRRLACAHVHAGSDPERDSSGFSSAVADPRSVAAGLTGLHARGFAESAGLQRAANPARYAAEPADHPARLTPRRTAVYGEQLWPVFVVVATTPVVPSRSRNLVVIFKRNQYGLSALRNG